MRAAGHPAARVVFALAAATPMEEDSSGDGNPYLSSDPRRSAFGVAAQRRVPFNIYNVVSTPASKPV